MKGRSVEGTIEMVKRILFVIVCVGIFVFAGCRTQPVIVDTGDIERLRHELVELGREHAQLQLAYRELAQSSQFFIDFHRNTAERIESGLGELSVIGTGSLAEIERLRGFVTVLRDIINGIISGEPEAGANDIGPD